MRKYLSESHSTAVMDKNIVVVFALLACFLVAEANFDPLSMNNLGTIGNGRGNFNNGRGRGRGRGNWNNSFGNGNGRNTGRGRGRGRARGRGTTQDLKEHLSLLLPGR